MIGEAYQKYYFVRPWWCHTGQFGLPYLIERRTGKLLPYTSRADCRAEWEFCRDRQEKARAYHREQKRLHEKLFRKSGNPLVDIPRAALFGAADHYSLRVLAATTVGTVTLALNSDYLAGTRGDAYAARIQMPSTKTLNSLYFFVSSYTGTAANVNDINGEVRPEASAGATTPDTATLTDSSSKDPASATGWIEMTGFTASLTGGSRYLLIIGDADGNETDYATVLKRVSFFDVVNEAFYSRFYFCETTGGWVSGNANNAAAPGLVAKFSDGSVYGSPISASGTPSSSTNQRGYRVTASAFASSRKVFGVVWPTGGSAFSGVNIWTGNNGPSGSPGASFGTPLHATSSFIIGYTGSSVTLSSGTAYSIVAAYASSSNLGPRRSDIGTGANADLRLALPGAGELYWREANGTTNWNNDNTNAMPDSALLLDGDVAAAGGGGARNPMRGPIG